MKSSVPLASLCEEWDLFFTGSFSLKRVRSRVVKPNRVAIRKRDLQPA
jgi:hypothetical protein